LTIREHWNLILIRFSTELGDAERLERVVAIARVLLAVASLLAIYVDPTQPARYYVLAYILFFVFALYSIGLLLLLSLVKDVERLRLVFCAADVIWVAILTAFTEGPNSPFFVFFIFVVVTAAYRWGFWKTCVTGIATSLLLVGQVLFWVTVLGDSADLGQEPSRFVMRSAYLLIISGLLGYLAEVDKRMRSERSLIERAIAKARAEFGLSHTLDAILSEVVGFYKADAAWIAAHDERTGRAYLTEYKPSTAALHRVRITEMEPASEKTYLFQSDAHAWYLSRRADGKFQTFAFDERGKHLPQSDIRLDEALLKLNPLESLLAVSVSFGEELSGRLYLLSARRHISWETDLRFLQTFARQVMPVIYNVYLWRRLRAKVGALERAHIARELHDGIVQSLVWLELHIENERIQKSVEPGEFLDELQTLVRTEVQRLRSLISQLRSVNLQPGEIVPFLADVVERFHRESGISAKFVCSNEDVVLSPRVCREIARIAQEALANIRKHSRARTALIRFGCGDGLWSLVIEDNGHGFEFSGMLSLQELDRLHKGPVTIKERVRLLEGELIIDSTPGAGSRLLISGPLRAPAI